VCHRCLRADRDWRGRYACLQVRHAVSYSLIAGAIHRVMSVVVILGHSYVAQSISHLVHWFIEEVALLCNECASSCLIGLHCSITIKVTYCAVGLATSNTMYSTNHLY
jgi:hypothetical protein